VWKALASAAACLVAAAFPDTAAARVTCSFDPFVGDASIEVTLGADGDLAAIEVGAGGEILVNGSPCSGATVTNVDSIVAKDTSTGGSTRVVLSDPYGLAPGATSEGQGPEIEVGIRLGDGQGDSVLVTGRPGRDDVSLGSIAGTPWINLNPSSERIDDVDVALVAVELVEFKARGHQDRLFAGGEHARALSTPAELHGGSENDELTGGSAADVLDGGGGFDLLAGGEGDDSLTGGPGRDLVSYRLAPSGTRASLVDGVAGGGEGSDTLARVELIVGSRFDDRLLGDRRVNGLTGGGGADVLRGGGLGDLLVGSSGNDALAGQGGAEVALGGGGADDARGGSGADLLLGNDGSDQLGGSTGDDRLFGGTGADRLSGADGSDALVGGPGRDSIDAGPQRDLIDADADRRRDLVHCGSGRDFIDVDRHDRFASDCEVLAEIGPTEESGRSRKQSLPSSAGALARLLDTRLPLVLSRSIGVR
jgi:RTX calcium-binding nonapeptide repeat (4 copies)